MFKMNIAVVGSRAFNDYDLLKNKIIGRIDPSLIERVVSGGAKGADSLAEQFANEFNLPMIIYRPDWDKLGKKAGYARNKLIIQDADIIFAFWDGHSKGTAHSIQIAKALEKEIIIELI